MSCTIQKEEFDDEGLTEVLYELVLQLKHQLDNKFKSYLAPVYQRILSDTMDQIVECVSRVPFTHSSVLEAQRTLLLIKEPILQLRFKLEPLHDSQIVLTVFALHELYNTIAKLLDTLHMFAHVEDHLSLDELDFRVAIQKHLGEMFSQDDE